MRYLDVKTDFAFKKVFGSEESKEILISFLNAVLTFPGNRVVEDLTIVDPYTIPMLKGMKDSYVDVKARLDDGSGVIIEMQVLNHPGFEKRVLYNAAKHYSMQLGKGEEYQLLNPVIALTIADFTMFEESDEVISHFKLLEKTQFIDYSDDIELVFVELPKFRKEDRELETIRDKWIYFIQNAGSLEFVPQSMEEEPIGRAFEIVNEANMAPEELEAQHKRKEFIYIQKSSLQMAEEKGMAQGMAQGMEKGMEKGRAEGVEEGVQKGKLETAKAMLAMNLPLETISRATGLEKEKILAL